MKTSFLIFIAPLLLVAPCVGAETPPGSIREVRDRIADIERELAQLPARTTGPSGGTFGFGSATTNELVPSSPPWVEIDLGTIYDIDEIFIVPAIVIRADASESTYGFPLRFKVEVATTNDYSDATTVLDASQPPSYPNPGRAPIAISNIDKAARFIRLTAFELSPDLGPNRAFLGLGELAVFSGNRNLALGKSVNASSTLATSKYWKPEFLVDGFTALGQPRLHEPGGTPGFLSASQDRPIDTSWVQIDLGNSRVIHELHLLPAHPRSNFASIHNYGYGFPPQFRIELSDDPEMHDAALLFEQTLGPFPNPGDNVISLPVDNRSGRYLRVTATRLFTSPEGGGNIFALAELEVLSGGKNIALGKTVTASSTHSRGGWSTAALVDGLSRDSRLLPIRDWLRGLDQRNRLERELASLQTTLESLSDRQATFLRWGTVVALLILLALFAILWRNRITRRRQINTIRDQIASDLHDEIGSNLGGIALVSESLARRSGLPENDAARLDDIARVARESSQTIRDIVWVLGEQTGREDDIILRMRQTSARMLEGIDYSFDVPSQDPTIQFPLETKRHLLLFFKEALHNIIKHAGASRVEISVAGSDGAFDVSVRDDGVGIDSAAASRNPSHLEKLRSRARRVPGRFDVTTAPGEGTRLQLHVTLN